MHQENAPVAFPFHRILNYKVYLVDATFRSPPNKWLVHMDVSAISVIKFCVSGNSMKRWWVRDIYQFTIPINISSSSLSLLVRLLWAKPFQCFCTRVAATAGSMAGAPEKCTQKLLVKLYSSIHIHVDSSDKKEKCTRKSNWKRINVNSRCQIVAS